jgi:hypothetical protein
MPNVMPMPPGQRYFPDINGAPLVGGFVYYYVADSDTPKDTYQDQGGTILNSNPIVLDERGMAIIWGVEGGIYRERVLDALGNEIYDRVTQVPCACADSGDGSGDYYEVAFFFTGEPGANQDVLVYNFSQDVSFADDFAGATPRITGTLPGSDIDLTITNVAADDTETDIGTMTITTAGVITITTTVTPEFVAGGAMIVTAPADSDGATDISCTFLGFPVAA